MFWISLAALVLCFQGCTPKKFATMSKDRIPNSQASNSSAEAHTRDQEKPPLAVVEIQNSSPAPISCPAAVACPVAPACAAAPACPAQAACPAPPPAPPVVVCPESTRPAPLTIPHCEFTLEGGHPVALGASINEKVLCRNLPGGAVVKIVDANDATIDKSQIIPVANNVPYVRARPNRGMVSAAINDVRIYSMRVEIYDGAQNALFHTENKEYGMSGHVDPTASRCILSLGGGQSQGYTFKFGDPIRERVYCANLTVFTEVRFIKTKNGAESLNRAIPVANKYDTPFQSVKDSRGDYYYDRPYELYDSQEKTGKYTSQILVKDRRNGQILFASTILNYELVPNP